MLSKLKSLNSRLLSKKSKSCTNCSNFEPSTGKCIHENLIFYNPIMNKKVYQSAENARSNPNLCGPLAKNYESKIENFVLISLGIVSVYCCISGLNFFMLETKRHYDNYKKFG